MQCFSFPDSACPPRRSRDAAQNQSPDTIQQDSAACHAQAGSASSACTNCPNVDGCARGAAAGATSGGVAAGERGSSKQADKAQGCNTGRSTAPVRCVISHNQFNLAPRDGRSSVFAPT